MAIPIQVNGKTVFVSTLDELLNFDYQEAIANDSGMDINDPFYDTFIHESLVYEEIIRVIDLPDLASIPGTEDFPDDLEDIDL